jgi:hypothetical protein
MKTKIGFGAAGGSLTALAIVLVACSSGTLPVGSKFVKTATVGTSGGTVTVAASDDSSIAGTSITIPANALKTDTTISIGISTRSLAPTGATGIGPVIDFEPVGTKFAVPVTITLPAALPSGGTASRVFVESFDGLSDSQVTAEYASGVASIEATALAEFGAIYGAAPAAACMSNADCAPGGVCVSSVCQGTRPEPDGGVDANVPGACSSNADCPSGEVCVSSVCTAPTVVPEAGTDANDGSVIVSDAGDAGDANDATTCPGTETDCSGVCVDLTSNNNNCGVCGMACPSGTTCMMERCF